MENRITIGMDLGDRSHHVCVLVGAGEGEQVVKGAVLSSPAGRALFVTLDVGRLG